MELIAYLLMLTIIYLISYSNRDTRSFMGRHNIDNRILKRVVEYPHLENVKFENVWNKYCFYLYIFLTRVNVQNVFVNILPSL